VASRDNYIELVARAYEGEIFGAALFAGLVDGRSDRDEQRKLTCLRDPEIRTDARARWTNSGSMVGSRAVWDAQDVMFGDVFLGHLWTTDTERSDASRRHRPCTRDRHIQVGCAPRWNRVLGVNAAGPKGAEV
jgi:hypothetical protein